MRAPLIVLALLVSAAILAGCTLPQETDPFGHTLTPFMDGVPGLSPAHARSHPVAMHLVTNDTVAVALAGTIARPDHRVHLVALSSGHIKSTFDVGLRPLALIADPMDNNRLLVTHPYTPTISVLDLKLGLVVNALPVVHYVEDAAFSPDGAVLVAVDRDQDRLLIYDVDRSGRRLALEAREPVATGPNPEHVVFFGPDLVAVSNRHGASITLVALTSGTARQVDIGGPPLALTARDGFLFVAGYGPGRGAPATIDGTPETGTADLENSLLVVDLRSGASIVNSTQPLTHLRYLSDTARPDNSLPDLRILAGASPRDLYWDPTDSTALWVTYQGTDQVQRLVFAAPPDGEDASTTLLSTPSGAAGTRLSHLSNTTPLTPGYLTDTTHAVYETGPGPRAALRLQQYLLTVSELSETIRITDLADCPGPTAPNAPCAHRSVPVVANALPYPSGVFEEGERLFLSALPSADQDRSCAGCHMDGLSDAKLWTLPHRNGKPMLTPRLDDLVHNSPWLIDGSVDRPSLYLGAAGGDLLRPDPADPWNLEGNDPSTGRAFDNNDSNESQGTDTIAKNDNSLASKRLQSLVARVNTTEAWMNAVFAFGLGEPRILPTPPRILDEAGADAIKTGAMHFRKTSDCLACHAADGPTFIPRATVDPTWGPPTPERLKARPLVGLFDREGTPWLHDGRASTLTDALLPATSPCITTGGGESTTWHTPLSDYSCQIAQDVALYTLAQNRDS